MPQPLPTPYDIAPIPYVPWTPSSHEWFLLLLATLIGLVLIAVWHLLKRGRRLSGVVDQLLKEIERSSHNTSTASTDRISRTARRVIEHTTRHDLGGLSSDELAAYAERCPTHEERTALSLVADLESHIYAPPSAEEQERLRQISSDLIPALKALIDARRRS
jgi:hypothetical protein